jgi:hypothetical protein
MSYLKNGLIINFWNDDIMFVTYKKWKMWIQKIYHINVRKKREHHEVKSLKIRCVGIFPILFFYFLKKKF